MRDSQVRQYRRLRREGQSAKSALAQVRETDYLWSYERGTEEDSDEIDGFLVTVKTHQDDDADLSYIGEFTNDLGDGFPTVLKRQSPGRGEYKYFVPANGILESAQALNKMGYSR